MQNSLVWVSIASVPSILIYGNVDVLGYIGLDLQYDRLKSIGIVSKGLNTQNNYESNNVNIEIDNSDGVLTDIVDHNLKNIVIQYTAVIDKSPVVLLSGIVATIETGTIITISMES